jgi:choline dehydrogenase-like flavoprotein
MRSGVGDPSKLGALGIRCAVPLPGVGQNLRDHPVVILLFELVDDQSRDPANPLVQAALRTDSGFGGYRNDIHFFSVSTASPRGRLAGVGGGWTGGLGVGAASGGVTTGISVMLNCAESAGSIEIVSADPFAKPTIDYAYLQSGSDLSRIRAGVEIANELSQTTAYRKVGGPRVAPLGFDRVTLDRWIQQAVTTGHHIGGTCRMGSTNDPMAVLDTTGQVIGVTGLRVVDTSAMPDVPRANTNATVLMLAEGIAEQILASL